jgi:hypothetical protein
MSTAITDSFPMLEAMLRIKGFQLQATYSIRDLAHLFNVSARAIQNRVASGQITARDLPGRAKFLPQDIEAFLSASKKVGQRRGR